jgi:trimeric autotransporter adhesin
MRRTLAWLVMAVGLAACGGGGGDPTVPTPTSPRPAAVASVTVTVEPGTILAGARATATATVRDATGATLSGRTVTWSSSTPAVATVDASGAVTGVAGGTATIVATVEGQAGSAAITVLAPVASVSVTPGTVALTVGGTQQLTALARDAAGGTLSGRTVTWSSGAPGVATVSAAGVVTAVAPGTAAVTATVEGQSGTVTVTVTPVPVATVSVTPAAPALLVGATQQMTAVPRDAAGAALAGRAVSWTSASPAVATVSPSGMVTGVSVGTAVLTATIEGISGSATVTVSNAPVASVTVSPTAVSLVEGTVQALVATARDAAGAPLAGRPITWSSSNPAVVAVAASGVVSAVAAGTATVTATAEGRSGTATVTVRAVALEPASITTSASAADTARRVIVLDGPTATWSPALSIRNAAGAVLEASAARWVVRDTTRATVSAGGVITGVREGRTFVVAQSVTNAAVADSVLVFVPRNASGPLLRAASPSYRIVTTDTFSITLQVEMRDGKALAAAAFEVAWPGVNAYPFDAFTVTSILTLQPGVVARIAPDLTETARVTFATTTPVSGTVALVRLNCRVRRRGVANQLVLTLNQAVASDLSDQTPMASVLNLMVIVP